VRAARDRADIRQQRLICGVFAGNSAARCIQPVGCIQSAAMESGTRVVGYARLSKAEQARNGRSLAGQEQAIRDECDRRGWVLARMIRDDGASGRDTARSGLSEALSMIANGEASGLVCAKLDRLSRSVVDFGLILEWMERASATLVALDLNVDTSTPGGRLVANVFASVAEWERDTISARTRANLAQARREGKPVSRPSFADSDDGRKLRERIRRMRRRGMTYGAIAAKLDADKVPTLRGGDRWSRASVQFACQTKRRKPTRKAAALPALT
jgi:DNA invertase Pin-like site-specific DNA recombinase